MTNEEAKLIEAISRDPADDTVRLAYADWLTENGDPKRAELIRIQCGLEQGKDWSEPTAIPTSERLKELQDREYEIINGMLVFKKGERPGIREFVTTPELAAILAEEDDGCITFKRGMIDDLSLSELPPEESRFSIRRQYNVTVLPSNLYVGGTLNLSNTRITELPTGLHVGSSLFLDQTPIAKLPHNLHLSGNLGVSHTYITELPYDLHVGGTLDLTRTPITDDAAQSILTMPNLSRDAKISGLRSLGQNALVQLARRLPETNTAPGTPPRP